MGNACVDRYLDTILSLFPKPRFQGATLRNNERLVWLDSSFESNGFTPVGGITIASLSVAIHLCHQSKEGSLARQNADFIIVDKNPAANITGVEKVEIVFYRGIGHDSAKLFEEHQRTSRPVPRTGGRNATFSNCILQFT